MTSSSSTHTKRGGEGRWHNSNGSKVIRQGERKVQYHNLTLADIACLEESDGLGALLTHSGNLKLLRNKFVTFVKLDTHRQHIHYKTHNHTCTYMHITHARTCMHITHACTSHMHAPTCTSHMHVPACTSHMHVPTQKHMHGQ